MLSRREFAGLLGTPLLEAAPKRPNILIVMTDDQGYGDLSCHGNPILRTPNIDKLHDESVRLTEFHVSATCAPTRSALLTGRHEFKNGVSHTVFERERLSLKSTTIAQVLQRTGYATGIFGKWHLGDAAEYQPNRRGFDEMFIHGCGGIGQQYKGTCADVPGNTYFSPVIRHNQTFVKTDGYCTDVFFRQAMQWIGEKRSKPFFAMITPNAPHDPLQCPEDYIAMYRGKTPNENVARFFGMVANMDDNIGRLTAHLKSTGLERDTLLIFLTDNGGTYGVNVFNDGMRGKKNTPFRGGTRVPSFWRWPGVLEPGTRRNLAAHLDIFPTLLDVSGAKPPAGVSLDGRSLLPLLRDARASWPDRHLFTHIGRWDFGKAAESKYAHCRVRNSRYSMINQNRGADGWELYDIANDPGETTDIAAPSRSVMEPMKAAYDQWWADVLPRLENEDAIPPSEPPYNRLYREWAAKATSAP